MYIFPAYGGSGADSDSRFYYSLSTALGSSTAEKPERFGWLLFSLLLSVAVAQA